MVLSWSTEPRVSHRKFVECLELQLLDERALHADHNDTTRVCIGCLNLFVLSSCLAGER